MTLDEPKFQAERTYSASRYAATIDLAPGDAHTLAEAEDHLKKVVSWCLSITDFSYFMIDRNVSSRTDYSFDPQGKIQKTVIYLRMYIDVDFMEFDEFGSQFKARWVK